MIGMWQADDESLSFDNSRKEIIMKKSSICLILVLMLALIVTGCNGTPSTPSNAPTTNTPDKIPSFEELLESNDLENVFKNHTNVYVTVEATSADVEYSYTEEVVYVKDDAGLCYHKRSKGAADTDYTYNSRVGNGFYYVGEGKTVSIMAEGDDVFFDYTLDFRSTPVGKGYIENGQIVYHTYYISEADEEVDFPASRYDYTLYFNKDSKLLERMDYVIYTADHEIDYEYSTVVSYDVKDVESKFGKTAYEEITGSEKRIELEIVANIGTPEQKAYSFVTATDSQILATFNDVTYLLYADPECQSLVADLTDYEGEKTLTLYAKLYEAPELPPVDDGVIPSFEELLEINSLENLFQYHANAYIRIESESSTAYYNSTEEVVYVKDDAGFGYHKFVNDVVTNAHSLISVIGNAYYYVDAESTVAVFDSRENQYSDLTLDFDSVPVGKGYIENGQIVYHTYYIEEADELFDASRADMTLYFNLLTKHIERIDYVVYNTDHEVEVECSITVSYDVDDLEDKLAQTAYDAVVNSEKRIELEIIANVGTPEQVSHSLVATTDSVVWAELGGVTHLLYADPECRIPVETLEAYEGQERLTLYAKTMESVE